MLEGALLDCLWIGASQKKGMTYIILGKKDVSLISLYNYPLKHCNSFLISPKIGIERFLFISIEANQKEMSTGY